MAPAVLVVLVLLAGGLFLSFGSRIAAEPFGDSHDGRNAGVWAAAGRALREGPIDSRLGSRSHEIGTYANHPPLIAAEVAVADALGGGSTAATRAPAWIGTVATLGLLALLLRERGLRGSASGIAILLVAATPMVLVFGTMLDTPVTSLPFAVALLLLWERARAGRRVPPGLAAGAAGLAVLAGWQSLLLAGVVACWALVRAIRGRGDRGSEGAFVAGALVGAALLGAWLWSAFGGSLRPLAAAYAFRSGGTVPMAVDELLARILHDGRVMLGVPAFLGVLGLVPALAKRSTRGLAVVALAVTVPYPLVFRAGAMNHEYWNFWFVLPIAVGLAAGGDWVLGALRHRRRADVVLVGLAAGVAGVLALGAWVQPTAAGWAIQEGARAGAVAGAGALPPDQAVAWYAGAVGKPASWISLPTRRPAVPVALPDIERLGAERPGDLILVGRGECPFGAPRISYAWETPADVLARPPDVSLCGRTR